MEISPLQFEDLEIGQAFFFCVGTMSIFKALEKKSNTTAWVLIVNADATMQRTSEIWAFGKKQPVWVVK